MKSKLITFQDAAEMLALHHTTIRQRKAGTEMLTHVAMGRRRMLVQSEVEALLYSKIKQSQVNDSERKSLLRIA